MNKHTLSLILFACFAFGLPLWAMQNNSYLQGNVHNCSGECYEQWQRETGGLLAVVAAQVAEKAAATPAQLGEKAYAGCIACHGAAGEGGIGPQLAGQSAAAVADKLARYKSGESLGNQSALMWSQAAQLSDADIDNIAAFIESL